MLATFVIKDGLRDSDKDQLALIQRAEDQFDARDQNAAIISEIVSSERMQYQVAKQSRKAVAGELEFEARANVLQQSPDAMASLISNTSQLSWTTGFKKEINDVGIDAVRENTELYRLQGQALTLFPSKLDLSDTTPITPEQLKAEANVSAQWQKTYELATNYGQRALQEAKRREIESRERYDLFTFLSYFLYTLGWIIGLVGRLIGPEEDSENSVKDGPEELTAA